MGRPRKTREDKPRRPIGRPPFKPTNEMRDSVEWRAAMGWSIDDCALELGISEPTFRLHFLKNYKAGTLRKRGQTIDMLVKSAIGGSVPAQKAVYAMTAKQPGETPQQPGAERPARSMDLGKKVIKQIEAEKAGEGTEWGSDLIPDDFRPKLN